MERYPFKQNKNIVDDVIETLYEDPVLKRFFLEHDLSHDTIEDHLNSFMTYNKEHPLCEDCTGLKMCRQDTLGYQPVLEYVNERVRLSYQPCNFLRHSDAQRSIENRVKSMYMPAMISQATLDDFHLTTDSRKTLYKTIMTIMNQVKLDEKVKGLYLTGRYQIGKTYTLGAMANYFAKVNKTVFIGYYPDMVREIKSSIKDGSLESIISELKHVDVLMLDDIGGESPSQWVRDEVLGPILQHRLLDEKLTFFSSNVPLKELDKYLTESDQRADKIKAFRIIERIRGLAEEVIM